MRITAVIFLALFLLGCTATTEMAAQDIIIDQEETADSDMLVADAIGSQFIDEDDFVEIGEMI
jgi:hypothetical protein